MSTRANVIIQESGSYRDSDGKEKTYSNLLYFYRHSDGYPEGVKDTLDKFVEWLKEGRIRDNLTQSAGWLVMLGAIEYNTIPEFETTEREWFKGHVTKEYKEGSLKDPKDWKVGAYEPTTGLHGDIEHLYLIDLKNKEWREIPDKDWVKYENYS